MKKIFVFVLFLFVLFVPKESLAVNYVQGFLPEYFDVESVYVFNSQISSNFSQSGEAFTRSGKYVAWTSCSGESFNCVDSDPALVQFQIFLYPDGGALTNYPINSPPNVDFSFDPINLRVLDIADGALNWTADGVLNSYVIPNYVPPPVIPEPDFVAYIENGDLFIDDGTVRNLTNGISTFSGEPIYDEDVTFFQQSGNNLLWYNFYNDVLSFYNYEVDTVFFEIDVSSSGSYSPRLDVHDLEGNIFIYSSTTGGPRSWMYYVIFKGGNKHRTTFYETTELDGLVDPSSSAYDINDLGFAVGWGGTAGEKESAMWSKKSSIPDRNYIGSLGINGDFSFAYGINDFGIIVGMSQTEEFSGIWRPYIYKDLSISELDVSQFGAALAINDFEQIIGYSDTSGETHAMIFAPNQDLGTLGGNESFAVDINDFGVIVGSSLTDSNTTHSFKYENGVMQDLGSLNGSTVTTGYEGVGFLKMAINNGGTIVGNWNGNLGFYTNSFEDLGIGGVFRDINDFGEAIGEADGIGSIVYKGNVESLKTKVYERLEEYIKNGEPLHPQAINNSGQIVGYGRFPNFGGNFDQGFILTPLTLTNIESFYYSGSLNTCCQSVSDAGDIDGDGYNDYLIGNHSDATNGLNAGKVTVYSGSDGSILLEVFGNSAEDNLGFSVAGNVDINFDGTPDLIVGAQSVPANGNEYVKVYSGLDGSVLHMFDQSSFGPGVGYSVSGIMDINGDDYDDIIVGSINISDISIDQGGVRVFSGMDGSVIYTFLGDNAGDKLGYSLADVGDVSGDGFNDILVGVPGSDIAGNQSGLSKLFSGGDGSILNVFQGGFADNLFGSSVTGVGDFNNDGVLDFAVGAPHNLGSSLASGGYVKVFSGLDNSQIIKIDAYADFDGFGGAIAGVGDINKDGYNDIAIGAPYSDEIDQDTGFFSIYYAKPFSEGGGYEPTLIFKQDGQSLLDGLGTSIASIGDGKEKKVMVSPQYGSVKVFENLMPTASHAIWQNEEIDPQNNQFTVEFDAKPSQNPMDGLTGLSFGEGSAFSDYAVLVRFAQSGRIDVRNGSTYSSDMDFVYEGMVKYHFRIVVDMLNRSYSVYIKSTGNTEQLLASNYSFRSEQSDITTINNYGIWSNPSSHRVSNFRITQSNTTYIDESHWLEAEFPDSLSGGLGVFGSGSASNGGYIQMPDGFGDFYSVSNANVATYTIDVAESGSYVLFARLFAFDGNDNSFFIQVDEGVDNLWDTDTGGDWLWDALSSRGGADPVIFNLSAGVHILKVKGREDGAKLDKFVLTNILNVIPSSLGEPAENIPPPVPTLTFNATPLAINLGEQSQLVWNSTNTDTCTASDGWVGSLALSNARFVSPTANTTYVIDCSGVGGNIQKSVTVTVVVPSLAEEHWLETEYSDTQAGSLDVYSDGTASSSQYIQMLNGSGSQWSPTTSYMTTYNVDIASAGDYVLWGRIIAPNGNDDSFYIQIDNGTDNLWDTSQESSWGWDQVSNRGGPDPVVFALSAGSHTIKIKGREDGVKIDKIFLSNDLSSIPSGIGNVAENIPLAQPTLSFSATPSTINLGESAQLDWMSAETTSCTASDGWSGSQSLSGVQGVTPSATTTYVLDCSGAGGNIQKSVTVTVSIPSSAEEHWLESEYPDTQAGSLDVYSDGTASSSQYIQMPNESGDQWSPTSSYMTTYNVDIASVGDYVLWGRIIAPTGNDDSFYIQIDNGTNNLWDTSQESSWGWDQVSNRGGSDPVVFNLTAGVHTIKIKGREDGTKIDKIFLSNDLLAIPSGAGNAAENIPLAQPTLNFSAIPSTINLGESAQLDWTSAETTSCTASNGWSGSQSLSGVQGVTPSTTTTYVLDCSGLGGNIQKSVTVTVSIPSSAEEHWLEAEFSDNLTGLFSIGNDSLASNTNFVSMLNGSGNFYSVSNANVISVTVNIAAAGDYVLHGRILAPNGNDNSFFVQIDSGVDNLWDTAQDSSWAWDQVSNRVGADPVIFNLTAGIHTIKIKGREDGTKIDKILLTNDLSFVPTGIGN